MLLDASSFPLDHRNACGTLPLAGWKFSTISNIYVVDIGEDSDL